MQAGKDRCETSKGVNDEAYWVCAGIDQERDNGSASQRSARCWRSPPQARGLGVTPAQLARLAEHGALARLQHGVYVVVGVPFDRHRGLQVARLALDPRPRASERLVSPELAVVSHESSAALHGIGNLDADVYELTLEDHRTVHQGPSPGPSAPANAQRDLTVNAPGMIR
ncbi:MULTISPECIES: type IV toxin-antitoxin system AbiEi family antitoxin domain-containing protein [Cryobacterium]|uniref:AbiEi antitoxin N-terminal domain-containing protein n=1 Tax=Cryobacterium levicorallinum TaxID=995038 RepID=A0A4R8VHU4_9MICO|nr:hypothetical protein E3O11_13315 [Cryobacterium levicorallinum]TFD64072.1 hypothetical protein E3T41_05055 [Cryobacterium sp. Hh38]